jgi:hypothetical protein
LVPAVDISPGGSWTADEQYRGEIADVPALALRQRKRPTAGYAPSPLRCAPVPPAGVESVRDDRAATPLV